jgi:hypothetical protein
LNIAEPAASVHRRLLFANVIAALETFLSDTFINRVLADDILLQRYLDTEKAFQEKKFPLKDALRVANDIQALATKELIEMVWHSINKVKRLYGEVILIDLGDIAVVARAIAVRHDIVHRNGRQKDRTERTITAADINAIIEAVRVLSLRVDIALNSEPAGADCETEPPSLDTENMPFQARWRPFRAASNASDSSRSYFSPSGVLSNAI